MLSNFLAYLIKHPLTVSDQEVNGVIIEPTGVIRIFRSAGHVAGEICVPGGESYWTSDLVDQRKESSNTPCVVSRGALI